MNDSSNDLDKTQFLDLFRILRKIVFYSVFVRLDEAGACLVSSNRQFSAIFNTYEIYFYLFYRN